MPAESETRVTRTVAEIEGLREVWSKNIGHRDGDIDFCLDYVWSGPEFIRPYVLSAYRAGRADALLVGRLEVVRMQQKIGYFRLPAARVRLLNFAHGGLLGSVSDENASEFVRTVIASLRTGEADAAFFDHLPIESALYRQVRSLTGPLMLGRGSRPDLHTLMSLAGNIDQVLAAFSPGLRAEVRRKKRKMTAEFGDRVTIQCYRDEFDLPGILLKVEEVAKRTYQRAIGVGFEDSAMMRRRLQLCARKEWLRIYILSIDRQPRAFWIGTAYGGVFYSDFNGYDPDLREYSPGTVLLIRMIEDFCKEEIRAVDFGFGQAEYKDRFSNLRSIEASAYIFAPSLRGITLNAIRSASSSVDTALRRVLERTDLLPKMKRVWRTRSSQRSED